MYNQTCTASTIALHRLTHRHTNKHQDNARVITILSYCCYYILSAATKLALLFALPFLFESKRTITLLIRVFGIRINSLKNKYRKSSEHSVRAFLFCFLRCSQYQPTPDAFLQQDLPEHSLLCYPTPIYGSMREIDPCSFAKYLVCLNFTTTANNLH